MAEEVREIPNIRITEHTMAHVKMKGHVMRKECSRTWQPTMNQFLQKPEWTWDPILPTPVPPDTQPGPQGLLIYKMVS